MRVCFVSPEYFSWGVYGGFGYLTKTLGTELADRGLDVSVVTARRKGQREVEVVDGVTVHGYPANQNHRSLMSSLSSRWSSFPYYKKANSDIYHSEAVSYGTIIAQKAMPNTKHIITFQDPYNLHEWKRISLVDSQYRLTTKFKIRLKIENRILSRACNCAFRLFSQAYFLIPKAVTLFNLNSKPVFLPNPVYIPRRRIMKANNKRKE